MFVTCSARWTDGSTEAGFACRRRRRRSVRPDRFGVTMNWSFLQAGCIDELSIVLAPAVSAEPEAALFDRSRFLPAGEAKGVQLIEAKVLEDGAVWLRYQPSS